MMHSLPVLPLTSPRPECANVTQEDAIAGLWANINDLKIAQTSANHAATLRNVLEATTCAVEHTGAHGGAPSPEGTEKAGSSGYCIVMDNEIWSLTGIANEKMTGR
jgi:hypothetical protein